MVMVKEIKKMYFYCEDCKRVYGCWQEIWGVRCSKCNTPCEYGGTVKEQMPDCESLDNGLCNECRHKRKDVRNNSLAY